MDIISRFFDVVLLLFNWKERRRLNGLKRHPQPSEHGEDGTRKLWPPNERRHKRQNHRIAVFTYSTGEEAGKACGAITP